MIISKPMKLGEVIRLFEHRMFNHHSIIFEFSSNRYLGFALKEALEQLETATKFKYSNMLVNLLFVESKILVLTGGHESIEQVLFSIE